MRQYGFLAIMCIFGIILIVVLIGIFSTFNNFTHTFQASESAFSDFIVFFLTLLKYILAVAAVLGTIWIVAKVYWSFFKQLAPTAEGNYPALVSPMSSITRDPLLLPPGNGPVPGHLHYDLDYHQPKELPPTQVQEIEAPPIVQPTMEEMYNAVRYNALEVPFGKSVKSGQTVVQGIIPGVHFKLVGGSGFGKSCLAAALLDVATKRNDPDHLRIALLDLEHKTSRLFEELPHVFEMRDGRRVIRLTAGDADEVARKLAFLRKELDRRASLNIAMPLLLVYVEEMLSLQYEVDENLKEQMLADLAILALRGRKYGIFLMACTQTDYSTKELREAQKQFRTRSGFAVDPTAARAAGFVNNELIKYNFQNAKPGRFVLEKPGFSELVLAPLYDVEQKLEEMLNPGRIYSAGSARGSVWVEGSSQVVPDHFPTDEYRDNGNHAGKQVEVDSEKLALMREMLMQHKSQNEIVATVFPGMRNIDAIAEYRKLLAALADTWK